MGMKMEASIEPPQQTPPGPHAQSYCLISSDRWAGENSYLALFTAGREDRLLVGPEICGRQWHCTNLSRLTAFECHVKPSPTFEPLGKKHMKCPHAKHSPQTCRGRGFKEEECELPYIDDFFTPISSVLYSWDIWYSYTHFPYQEIAISVGIIKNH